MLKKTLCFSFLCFLALAPHNLASASDVQDFITMAQDYSDQLKLNSSYKNQGQLARLAAFIPTAQKDLVEDISDHKIHVAQQQATINTAPGTLHDVATALQKATSDLTAAQLTVPQDEQKVAQLTADLAKADENVASRNVYDARITLEKTLCASKDFTPLKTALAQGRAILNPHDLSLKVAATQAERDGTAAALELKSAEDALNAQWKIFNQKVAATQKALKAIQ